MQTSVLYGVLKRYFGAAWKAHDESKKKSKQSTANRIDAVGCGGGIHPQRASRGNVLLRRCVAFDAERGKDRIGRLAMDGKAKGSKISGGAVHVDPS